MVTKDSFTSSCDVFQDVVLLPMQSDTDCRRVQHYLRQWGHRIVLITSPPTHRMRTPLSACGGVYMRKSLGVIAVRAWRNCSIWYSRGYNSAPGLRLRTRCILSHRRRSTFRQVWSYLVEQKILPEADGRVSDDVAANTRLFGGTRLLDMLSLANRDFSIPSSPQSNDRPKSS